MTQGEGKPKNEAVEREERVLAFWKERGIFHKSLEKEAPNGEFVFYEGPPTANGRPGVHHLESRAFKDALPRYKTMRGYRVRRRAGWDTHGLPVELEVEKELGFSGKKDIESYGIAAFNKKCRESVWKYVDEWQRFTDRIGYWVDQDQAYYTYDPKFMESVWAVAKKIDTDGRLYKDYKVLPWCSRCGTALSSHELAQGYADVKDLSVTVKFELVDEPGTYLLAWTTTPWTLPGNVALAVGENIEYVKVGIRKASAAFENDDELGEKQFDSNFFATFIVAKERLDSVFKPAGGNHREYDVLDTFKGSELVGKQYTPLYPFVEELASDTEKPKFAEKAFRVYAAPFVTTEDGTGIVHTAVMYGADDFDLGTQVGLPKVHLVGADGKFLPGTGFLEGRFVREEDEAGKPTLAVDVITDLKGKNAFFSQENYKHTYPFCWRCKTPLIYYARDSWFVRMFDLRETLLAENAKVHWEPEHIRDGRMGEWLANAKEWAVSRERYWGTPLPVWESEDKRERVVIGSVEELRSRIKTSGNTYFAMRHGEAEQNVSGVVSCEPEAAYSLTEAGKGQADAAAESLKDSGITRIYTSPYRRAKETTERVRAALGLPESAVVTDERLGELNFGDLSGKPFSDFSSYAQANLNSLADALPNGESYGDAVRRFGNFLYELERTTANEKILIVSHGIAIESFTVVTSGASGKDAVAAIEKAEKPYATPVRLDFVPLPHDDDYALDLHRPYIDDVVLVGDSGQELRRVPEVMDVWFDSGAMPFAQDHYPFENKERVDGPGYPADFISEAIDQTRGWFYTLLAIGVLMGKGTAYRAVICLGHLLDEKGQKMSKSKGNVVNPWEAMDQWGADTLRFWMYSVNQPGDSKSFDEKTVKEAARALSWLDNSAKFYALFKDAAPQEASEQAIDRWIRARTNETVMQVTVAMDALKPYDATRSLAKLFEDLSQWYVRRVRDRARDGDSAALATLRDTLRASALMLAPFAPFLAEDLFQQVRGEGEPESVHLCDWPKAEQADTGLIEAMAALRSYASQALMLRNKVGLPVRQPLASLTVPAAIPEELLPVLAEEVNVEQVLIGHELSIDTNITDELRAKGDERAFQRAVAEARKTEGFSPKDQVTVEKRDDGPHTAELSTGAVRFALVRA